MSFLGVNIGKIGGIIKFLKQHGATQVLFAGKALKIKLYEGKVRPDLKAIAMFMKARDRRDDSLMDTLSDMFEDEGIKVADMRRFCSSLIVEEGYLAGKKPGKSAMKDVEFGFRMAKGIGELDIGQTVVVKDRNVVAVEAIEGTDKAIIRGGELAGDGSVVVKVFRPKQNPRYDLPAAGIATLKLLGSRKIYSALERTTKRLCNGIQKALFERDIKHTINRIGSMFTVFFNPGPVTDYVSAVKSNTEMYAKFHNAMLREGIYLPPSQFEACFVSTEHKQKDFDKTTTTIRKLLL